MPITDGLHAQVFLWTGDPRTTIQFDNARLVVRSLVTRTYSLADWLTVDPISGTLEPGTSKAIRAVFDSRDLTQGVRMTAINVQSNDPDSAVTAIPVTLTVDEISWLYLPVVMRD